MIHVLDVLQLDTKAFEVSYVLAVCLDMDLLICENLPNHSSLTSQKLEQHL